MNDKEGYTLTLTDNWSGDGITITTEQGADSVVKALARAMVALTFGKGTVKRVLKEVGETGEFL